MGQNRIGERIESCCKEKKLSYYVLSRQAKVPLTTILHIVDGTTKNPGVFTVVKLYQALEIPLTELAKEETDRGAAASADHSPQHSAAGADHQRGEKLISQIREGVVYNQRQNCQDAKVEGACEQTP